MPKLQSSDTLGRRERQIMDVIHRLGAACVADVRKALPDPPTYSAVRGMLRLLEEKGHVQHEWSGPRHLYRPTRDLGEVQRSAARHLLRTFFNGSMESAVAAMLGAGEEPPTAEELRRLTRLIQDARKKESGR